jgi:hypothetical protein
MEKEFISYEQALELKELGFDEECLFAYYGKSDLSNFKESDYVLCGDRHNSSLKDGRVSAPLYQQVFKWFREKYELRISNYRCSIKKEGGIVIGDGFRIFKYGKDTISTIEKETYEKAELECLKKLIEVVKQQKMLNDGRTI